jgi:ABC-type Na+ efflux pump permease subunit
MSTRWSEILTLYRWELTSALRDRTIVVNSVVVPLVLYPLMLWAMFSGMAFVRGQTDDMASRVAVLGLPARHDDLLRRLREDERIRLSGATASDADARAQIQAGQLDAALVAHPAAGALPDNFSGRVAFDGSRERSDLARRRVLEIVGTYREDWLRREALARGVEAPRWTAFAVEGWNTASSRDMGAFLLGLMLPLFFVVMVALGCLTPAIDLTAGERERQTWETLMSSAASRANIVIAKYLAVATLGGVAGLLNVVAMLLTMRGIVAPLLGGDDGALEFGLSWSAVPVVVAGAVLLAGLVAAGMMVLASFARTFREGQAMVSPFYLATLLPVMFLGTPGITLTLPLALVPVINIALLVREAFNGTIKPLETVVAVVTTLAAIGLLLRLAKWILSTEDVVVGSYGGSFATFLRDRLGRGRTPGTRTP